jgi:hypothetical protein
MEKLSLAAAIQTQTVLKCPPGRVYVDGVRRRDMHVLSWEVLGPPVFGRVMLTSQPVAPESPPPRIEDFGSLPAIGSVVLIRPAADGAGEDFCGFVTAHRLEVGQDGERLVVEAEHQLSRDLANTVACRWQLDGGQAVRVDSATVVFNADGHLASPDATWVAARQTRLFDTCASARPWTVSDALGYLLATAVGADVECPTLWELAELAGNVDLGTVEITALSVAEAMMRVAQRGGLALRAARGGKGLVFYRPGRGGRRVAVRLQPAGQRLSTGQTNLWRGWVSIRRRPSRPAVLALGDHKRYESTFQALPGWDTSLESSRWRDFVRSESPDWPLLADVYRKWVLNEHDWYGQAPWNLAAYDFSSISAADFVLKAPRRLLPCLSSDRTGASLGVVVEFRCDEDSPWLRWRGPLWVSQDECAVYLGGDTLPGDYFEAGVAGSVQLRITASVFADARLTVQIEGSPAYPQKVLDLSSRAKWSAVHAGSIFYGRTDLGDPASRDDALLLQELASRAAEAASKAVEAELDLGWIDTSYHVGDIVELIEGRAVELPSRAEASPCVQAIRHDFGIEQRTRLFITG